MNLKKNVLFFLCIVMVFSTLVVNSNFSYAKSFVKDNEVYKFRDENIYKKMDVSNSNEISDDNSYIWPDILSSEVDTISYMNFSLRDDFYNKVTGIVVNKIEIFQGDTKILSSNEVDSYSVVGRYYSYDTKIINEFNNKNGENIVDVVFYLYDDEVARIENYEMKVYSNIISSEVWPLEHGVDTVEFPINLTILNADESADIDVWLEDEEGNKITENLEIYDKYYYDENCEVYCEAKLSFKDQKYLNLDAEYDVYILVNGEKISFAFEYNEFYLLDESWIYRWSEVNEEGPYIYEAAGINLLNNGPYKIYVEQDGEMSNAIDGIEASMDEMNYVYITEDITSIIQNPGEEYKVYLYDENENLIDEESYLETRDEVKKDIIEPEEEDDEGEKITIDENKYDVMPSKEDVSIMKNFVITFNKELDGNTITNENIYVENAFTGEKIDNEVRLQDDEISIMLYHPDGNYEEKNTYYLIINDEIKSYDGKALEKAVIMEFEIE